MTLHSPKLTMTHVIIAYIIFVIVAGIFIYKAGLRSGMSEICTNTNGTLIVDPDYPKKPVCSNIVRAEEVCPGGLFTRIAENKEDIVLRKVKPK